MGLFEQFPYSNFHSINLDWIIEKVKTTLESAVMSVNGQTGEVILYQSENVVFPDVDSNQWRMVRTAGGHTAGVLFNQDYMYVMYDNIADRVYTMNHPQIIFPDAATRLPDVTEDYTNIRRQIETSGVQNIVGIELRQNKAYRMKDQYRYEIYDSDNPPPYPVTSVNGQTGTVILAIPFTDVEVDDVMFSNPASGHEWGIARETTDGTATIQIITNATKAEAYIDFFDEGGQVSYTKKLLTTDDIPSSSGVVSVNGQNGVVTIYGDTMPIESGSADSVKDVTDALDNRLSTAEGTITQHGTDIGTINTKISQIKSDIAIVEDTNNATHNIAAGQHVIWKGLLYKATSNISIGDGLSGSNLSAIPSGGLNDIQNQVSTLNNNVDSVCNSLAYIVGTTNRTGLTLTSGTFIYVKNNGNGVSDGLYSTAEALGSDYQITPARVTAIPNGGFNLLNSKIPIKHSETVTTNGDGEIILSNYNYNDVISVTTETTANYFTGVRKTTSGNVLVFVFNDDFAKVANTPVNLTIWTKG